MDRRWFLGLALGLLVAAPAFARLDDKDKEGAKNDEAKTKEKIIGKWKLIEGERGGQPPPEDFAKSFKLEFKKDGKFTVWINEQEMDGEFTIDIKPKNWEVDFKLPEGTRKGIFKFDGEKLKACVADPDQERPKDFASKEGSTDFYFVFEREKKDKEKDK